MAEFAHEKDRQANEHPAAELRVHEADPDVVLHHVEVRDAVFGIGHVHGDVSHRDGKPQKPHEDFRVEVHPLAHAHAPQALERRDGPAALIFTRQNCAFVERDEVDADAIAKGGYIAAEAPAGADKVQAVIVATGSEVGLAVEARKALAAQNIQARVVSMPCTSRFDACDEASLTRRTGRPRRRRAVATLPTVFGWL